LIHYRFILAQTFSDSYINTVPY